MSGTFHKDVSMFVLLTAVRNTLQLYSSVKGTCSLFSVATLNGLMLLPAVHGRNVYANVPHFFVIVQCLYC